MHLLIKINKFLNMLLASIGGVFLVGMILLTCANIFIRQFYIPIRGTFELMGFAGAIVTAFSLGYTQLTNGHIAVDILVNSYPKTIRRTISIINYTVCCVFFLIVSWHIVLKALTLKNAGEVSETLRIVYYPFIFAVALGCLVLSLALFTDFLKIIWPQKEDTQ